MPVGKHLLEAAMSSLNAVELGNMVESIEVMVGRRSPVGVTAMQDTFEQGLTPNIRRWGARITLFQDYSSSANRVFNTLKGILDSTGSSGVAFIGRPSTAIRGENNPDFSGQVGIDGDFPVLSGAVGDPHKVTISLKGLGNLSILTSSS
jgi:hypothetical protein